MNRVSQISLMCACLVVLLHVPKSCMHCDWFLRLVPNGVCTMAVPCFFAVSGFMLGRHVGERNWWQSAVKKRLRTLLVPYVFWCGLMAALPFPFMIAANVVAGRSLFANFFPHGWWPYFVSGFGLDFSSTPMLVAYWYVRALMLFVLCSRLISPIVRRRPLTTIGVIWVGGVLLDCLLPAGGFLQGFATYGFRVVGFAYFVSGMAIGCETLNVCRLSRNCGVGIGAAILALGFLAIRTLGIGGEWILHVFSPFAILAIWLLWPKNEIKALSPFASFSFVIFTLHPFCIYLFKFIGAWILPSGIISYGIYAAACIILSIILGLLVRRSFPRFSAAVFGGR